MNLKTKLLKVVSICLRAWDDHKLNDLAPVMIAEDVFTDRELEELVSNDDLAPLWEFVQCFCDAAQHRFPDVGESCSILQGETVMRDIQGYLSGRLETLSPATRAMIEAVK